MEIVAFIVSVLALATAGASVVYTRRQAVVAEKALSLAEQEAARYPAPWSLRWVKGDTYGLTNGGDQPVYDVELELPPNSVTRGEIRRVDRLSAGSTHTFLVGLTMGSPHRDVTVTWARTSGGERHDWTGPLPAKP